MSDDGNDQDHTNAEDFEKTKNGIIGDYETAKNKGQDGGSRWWGIFARSKTLSCLKQEEDTKTTSKEEPTVKELIEARRNRNERSLFIPFVFVLVILVALFCVANWSLLKNGLVLGIKGGATAVFAAVVAVAGFFDLRVKANDYVIEGYRKDNGEIADLMDKDPWVARSRIVAIVAKYVSLLAVFMAALLAIQ